MAVLDHVVQWLKAQRAKTIALVALVCLVLVGIGCYVFVKTPASYVVSDMQQRMCIERIHAMASQFSIQHTIPREAYVTHQRISSALHYRLTKEETGVFVFYAPSGYGKSTITTHVLHDLLEQKTIEGVIRLNGYDFNSRFKPESVLDWVSSAVQCPQANIVGLSGLFASQERKTVILIDQFEALFRMTTADKVQTLIHNVAMESVSSQQFVVLLLTQTEESCQMSLSWNGGEKISSIFRDMDDPCHPYAWSAEDLMHVARRHLDELQSYTVSKADRFLLETLIRNNSVTQVGKVVKFLKDHCLADYHCGRTALDPHQQHPPADSPYASLLFVIVFLLLVGGALACVCRYRSSSAVKRFMKTP